MNVLEQYYSPIEMDLRISLKKYGSGVTPRLLRTPGFDGSLKAICIKRELKEETNFFEHTIFLKTEAGQALVETIPGIEVVPTADSFIVLEAGAKRAYTKEEVTVSGMIMSKGPFIVIDENDTHIKTIVSLETTFALDIPKENIVRFE